MSSGITDEKLNDLAEAIATNKNLPKLGFALGFRSSRVDMYISANKRNDNWEGTSTMLFDWKRKTSRAEQIPNLVKAMTESDMVELAEEFFSEEGEILSVQSKKECAPTSASQANSSSSSNEREVSNKEVTKLSGLLPPGKYDQLVEALGFDYNYHQQILSKHRGDIRAAVKELLQEWKTNKGGRTGDLEAAMQTAEVGGLIPKYKN